MRKNRVVRQRLVRTRIDAQREGDAETARACRELLREVGLEEAEHKSLICFSFKGQSFNLVSAGPVGRAVLLLYCGNLFSSDVERQKCMRLSMRDQELDLLLSAASKLRSLDLSPLDDPAVIDVLKRLCSSSYFTKEDVKVASRVVRKMMLLNEVCVSELWTQLFSSLKRVYQRAGFIHYRPSGADKLDFDKVSWIKYSLQLDPVKLLGCLDSGSLLADLVTRRPPNSVLPHCEVVMLCIEHAVMWLNAPDSNVFYPLRVTYGDLQTAADASASEQFMKLWNVRAPSYLERVFRHDLFSRYAQNSMGVGGGELHFLKPEDYEDSGALGYLLPCLRDDLSEKQLEVFRTLRVPYRSRPENQAYSRSSTCGVFAEVCKEVMPMEPPHYHHLYH